MTMKYNEKPWGGVAQSEAGNPLGTYVGNFHFSVIQQSFEDYQDPLSSIQFSLNSKPHLCKVHPSKYLLR